MASKDRKKIARLSEEIRRFNSAEFRRRRKLHNVGLTGEPRELDSLIQWGIAAWVALRLQKEDRILKKAFKEFDLDPDDPSHWKDLASSLASALFRERKRAGAPRKWDRERYLELIEMIKLRLKANPQLRIAGACKYIAASDESPSYFRVSGKALQKALERAKDEGIEFDFSAQGDSTKTKA